MRILLSLLALSVTLFCQSQDLKKMKGKGIEGWEKFYVLKSDNSIRHGKYEITSYTPPFHQLASGFYKKGLKDSLWTEKFNLKGHKIKSQGFYKNDEKVGIWIYNNNKGELIQKYDHDKKKIISSTECADINNCEASVIGGLQQLAYDLSNELIGYDFPMNESGRTLIQFRNLVSIQIEPDGSVTEVTFRDIIEDKKLEEYIKEKIEKRTGKWIAATQNGVLVSQQIKIPIALTVQY